MKDSRLLCESDNASYRVEFWRPVTYTGDVLGYSHVQTIKFRDYPPIAECKIHARAVGEQVCGYACLMAIYVRNNLLFKLEIPADMHDEWVSVKVREGTTITDYIRVLRLNKC